LREGHAEQLFPAREIFDVTIAVVSLDAELKFICRDKNPGVVKRRFVRPSWLASTTSMEASTRGQKPAKSGNKIEIEKTRSSCFLLRNQGFNSGHPKFLWTLLITNYKFPDYKFFPARTKAALARTKGRLTRTNPPLTRTPGLLTRTNRPSTRTKSSLYQYY
jgi:hypothetical protein